MAIPQSIIDKCLIKAKESTFFGIEINKLTREELIACAMSAWEGQMSAQAESKRILQFMQETRGTR